MLLAQAANTNPTIDWAFVVSLIAVVVALGAAVNTWWQGRAIRRIETKEHQWQEVDRNSAFIVVTPHIQTDVLESGHGMKSAVRTTTWIRLKNTGRATATDIIWESDDPGWHTDRRELQNLHPGEYYDLYFSAGMAVEPDLLFVITWSDKNGSHGTERVLRI